MKTNSIRDEYGNFYYHIALEFISADGLTPESALKLSTYEDLTSIKTNLHYFIDKKIDCGGKELFISSFDGSIRGTFAPVPTIAASQQVIDAFNNSQQFGAITNFVVQNNGGNCGLFGILDENAQLNN